jgi:glutamate-1-semialdehyde aminotransferase
MRRRTSLGGHHDQRALAGEQARRGSALAAAGASDNLDPAVELSHDRAKLASSAGVTMVRAGGRGAAAADQGVIFRPRHNWFISAAHTESDVERALVAARAGFKTMRDQFGSH